MFTNDQKLKYIIYLYDVASDFISEVTRDSLRKNIYDGGYKKYKDYCENLYASMVKILPKSIELKSISSYYRDINIESILYDSSNSDGLTL